MSGQQPAARSPFAYASDYDAAPYSQDEPTLNEHAIPLITPFQRYLLEGLDKLWKAQDETKQELQAMKASVAEMAPQVKRLEADAVLLKKVLTYGKYVAFGLVTRYFPEFAAGVAKHAPAILEAAGKASGQ